LLAVYFSPLFWELLHKGLFEPFISIYASKSAEDIFIFIPPLSCSSFSEFFYFFVKKKTTKDYEKADSPGAIWASDYNNIQGPPNLFYLRPTYSYIPYLYPPSLRAPRLLRDSFNCDPEKEGLGFSFYCICCFIISIICAFCLSLRPGAASTPASTSSSYYIPIKAITSHSHSQPPDEDITAQSLRRNMSSTDIVANGHSHSHDLDYNYNDVLRQRSRKPLHTQVSQVSRASSTDGDSQHLSLPGENGAGSATTR
jgi:hypothetical protein